MGKNFTKTNAGTLSNTVRKKRNGIKLFLYALPMIVIVFIFNYLPLWGWSFAFFQYKAGKSVWDCVLNKGNRKVRGICREVVMRRSAVKRFWNF